MKNFNFIRHGLCVIFGGIFLFSGYKILSHFTQEKEAKDTYANFSKTAISSTAATTEQNEIIGPEITVDFNALAKQSEDIVAWIYSPNTVINYPVVKGEDNSKYLHHLPNGEYNIAGSIFADYRNEAIGKNFNYIIYGHHMKNDTMFGTLLNYKSQKYYDAHPVIYLLAPDKNYKILLYSAFVTYSDSEIYLIDRSKKDEAEFMDEISRKSTFKTNAEYNEGDKIVTLSTCTNVSDEQRYVLIGILKEIE